MGNNQHREQNSESLATCIMDSLSEQTRAYMKSIYATLKIDGHIYGELVFKALMNKAVIDNKKTTRHLQDRYDSLPQFMTSCDSIIPEFILEWREVVALLEARGEAINDKFKVLWRAFELVKDENVRQYMVCKQESHEEDDSSALTVDKLLKFAQDKYTERTRANSNIWGSSSQREEEVVALAAEISNSEGTSSCKTESKPSKATSKALEVTPINKQ